MMFFYTLGLLCERRVLLTKLVEYGFVYKNADVLVLALRTRSSILTIVYSRGGQPFSLRWPY